MDNRNGATVAELTIGLDENVTDTEALHASDPSARIPTSSQTQCCQSQGHQCILVTNSSLIPSSVSWPESLPSTSDRTATEIADDDSSTLNTDFDLDWTPPSSPANSDSLLFEDHMDRMDTHPVKQSQTCVSALSCISTLESDEQTPLRLAKLSTSSSLAPSWAIGPQLEPPKQPAAHPRKDSITRSMRFNLEDFPPITITPVPSRNSKYLTPLKIRPCSLHGTDDIQTAPLSENPVVPSPPSSHLIVEDPASAVTSRVAFAFPILSVRIGRLRNGSLYWLTLFFFFNLALKLYNKGVLIKLPYPYTLTAIHAFFGSVWCHSLHSRHFFVSDHILFVCLS